MKALLILPLLVACASCTMLENRRDLYRSPAEGYEQWYPKPPPTRLPSMGPVHASSATGPRNGVISFPDE